MADSWRFCFNFSPEVINSLDFTQLPAAGLVKINGGRVQIDVPKIKGEITKELFNSTPQIAHLVFFATENLKTNPKAQSYLKARGISTAAAIKAGIGWADFASVNNGGDSSKGAAAIFLMQKADGSLGGVQWRGVLRDERGNPKSAAGSLTFGQSTVHHPFLFESEPVAICEGAFDAATIIMRGRRAISLYGVSNFPRLFAAGEIKAPLVIATDRDEAGKAPFKDAPQYAAAAQIVKEQIFCDGVEFGDVKDVNDLLLKNPALLDERLAACFSLCEKGEFLAPCANLDKVDKVDKSEPAPAPFDFVPISEESQNFFNEIAKNKALGAIPTFSTPLNNALGGGFKAGRLYVVGAPPALGKTALALQIGNHAAAWAKAQNNGVKVLFFSLELGVAELLARAASRLSFEYAKAGKLKKGYSTDAILSGNMPTNELEMIHAAANSEFWGDTFILGGHFGDIKITDIAAILEEYKRQFATPPLVIVDYFQIIESSSEAFKTDKQRADENISRLKGLATRLEMPILLISALARAHYDSEPAIDAFKESGKIEYTADVLIALEIAREKEIAPGIGGAKGKTSKENARKKEVDAFFEATKKGHAGKVELKILKQRLGVGRQSVELLFNPLKNTFTDIPTDAEGNLYSFADEPPWASNEPQIKVF